MLKKIFSELSLVSPKAFLFVVLYFLLAILEGLTDGIGVGLLTSFITNLSLQDTSKSIELFKQTYSFLPDFIFISEKTICFTIIALFFIRIVIVMLTANFKCIIPQEITYRVRNKILERTFSFSLFDIEQKRSGMIINLLTRDSSRMSLFIFSMIELNYVVVLLCVYLFILLLINKFIFGIGILLALPFVVVIRLLTIVLTKMSKKLLSMRNEITSNCTEKISNIRFIKSIGTEYQEYQLISNSYKIYRNIEIKRYFTEYFGSMMPQFFILIGLSSVIYLSIYEGGQYKSYISIYVLPMGFIGMRCFSFISQLNTKYLKLKQDFVSASAILDFWETHKNYFSFTSKSKKDMLPLPTDIKSILFDNVSFSYDKHDIIKNFSMVLEKGKPVIVKGKSGAGKTTIANLLRILIEPQKGSILLNNIPISSFNTFEFRHAIGYVTQEAIMMYGTILENLLYGLDYKPQKKQIENVLKETGCDEFINILPDKLNTVVSEKGSNFSGGQKQRLALARILLRNPDILILDEITNNLDKKSKKDIILSINKLVKNRICIIITHDDEIKLDNEKHIFL